MQLSRLEVLPDLPDSVLWKLARFLPDHQTDDTAHRTFCLLGRSWRNAYCSSRHAVTLHLGPRGLGGIASRVLAGSGGSAIRLEVRMDHWQQAQVQPVAAALSSLPKLQVLILHVNLDPEDMAALAPALGALGGLRELNLHIHWHKGAADADAALLAQALQNLTGLQHLYLWCCPVMAALAPSIQQLTGLLSLDLGNTHIMTELAPHLTALQKLVLHPGRLGSEDTAAIARALMQLGGLQELELSGCCMIEGIGPLAPAIGGLSALRQLRFDGYEEESSNLSAEDVEALAHALARRTGLQLLHLNGSDLGQQGAAVVEALASALRRLTGLTDLDLNDNDLDAEALTALAPALVCLTGLVNLSIGLDFVSVEEPGTKAAQALAPTLAVLTQLTRLQLIGRYLSAHSSEEADDPGMAALASAIGGLVHLRHLVIRDSDMGECGARAAAALGPAVQRLTQLQLLDLSYSYLDPAGVAALAPALQHLTGLRHLDLSENCLEAGGAAALAPVLPQMTGLQHLDLSDNSLGVAGVEVLAPALALIPGLQLLDLRWNDLGGWEARAQAPALAGMLGLAHLKVRI